MARRDIDRLQDEIEELFADLWQVPRFSGMRRGFRPQVDCFRTEDPRELTIVVELPGVDPDALQVVAVDHALVLAGERLRPRREGQLYQQVEIEYGEFERRIPLPADADPGRATASYDRGMLTITVPTAAPDAPRGPVSIQVRRPT